MKHKKFLITIIILLTAAFSYTAIAGFSSTPTRAKGLVAHWSLSDEDFVLVGNNLVTNGDMELDSDWIDQGTPPINERSTVQAHTGTYSRKVTANGQWEGAKQTLSVTANKTYIATAWVYADPSNDANATISIREDSGGDQITPIGTSVKGEWVHLSKIFEVGAETDIRVYLLSGTGATSAIYYWDDVVIKEIAVSDLTPNGNNGTVYGAEYTTDRNGQSNKAMDFDGSTDYIKRNNTAVLSFGSSQDFSISTWFNTSNAPSYTAIVGKKWSWIATGAGYGISMEDGQVKAVISDSTDLTTSVSGTTYNDGEWHHVVATFDRSGSQRLYVDDVLKDTDSISAVDDVGNSTMYIGRWAIDSWGGYTFFNGSIQDVRIYNKVLSATEIGELYQGYNPSIKVGAKKKGLVGEWSLGEEDKSSEFGNDQVVNGAFGSDVTGWSGYNDNTISHDVGNNRMQVVSGGASYTYADTNVAIKAGQTYRATITYEGADAGLYRFGIGDIYAAYSYYIDSSNSFTKGVRTYTFTPSSNYTQRLKWTIGGGSTRTLYYDDVTLKEAGVNDLTPNGNNGVVYGAGYTTDRNSQSNKAMSFNGTSDYINIDGVVADVANDTQGTWSMWVKPDDGQPTSDQILIAFGDTDGDEYLRTFLDSSGDIHTQCKDAGTTQWSMETDAVVWADLESTWKHIAVVQDGTSPVIYVNGVSVARSFSTSTSIIRWMSVLTGLDNMRIGDRSFNNNGEAIFFDGSISNVKIYNRALSAAEILDVYDDYKPIVKVGALRKGLIGHWTLDDKQSKSDTVVADATIYENNGTMTSMTFSGNETTDRHGQTRALSFDGGADYINIDGIVADVASDTAGTWAAWVKPDTVTPGAVSDFVSINDTDAVTILNINIQKEGDFRSAINIAGTVQWILSTDALPFSVGVWAHVALVQDGVFPVLYVNGIAPAQTFETSTDITAWINDMSGIDNGRIGARSINSVGESAFFAGSISDVRIYNRALSAEEIEMLYESY